MRSKKTKACPFCGESIPENATACPLCGSDERTGWSENTYLDGIDLGGDSDYDEIRQNEFSEKKRKTSPWQIITVGILLLLFIAALVRSLFQ